MTINNLVKIFRDLFKDPQLKVSLNKHVCPYLFLVRETNTIFIVKMFVCCVNYVISESATEESSIDLTHKLHTSEIFLLFKSKSDNSLASLSITAT